MYTFEHATPELFAALAANGAHFMFSNKYPGYYITEEGHVFSCRSKRFLRPMKCGKYLAVEVMHESGKMVRRYVHRLVAEVSHGCDFPELEVCHNDGNPHNNAVSNLRFDTRTNNMADKIAHGTANYGERNPMAKLTNAEVNEIRQRVSNGEKQISMCASYGVSPMTISRLVRGETWRHV